MVTSCIFKVVLSCVCALADSCRSSNFIFIIIIIIASFPYSLLFRQVEKYCFIDLEYCADQVNKTGIILLIYSQIGSQFAEEAFKDDCISYSPER